MTEKETPRDEALLGCLSDLLSRCSASPERGNDENFVTHNKAAEEATVTHNKAAEEATVLKLLFPDSTVLSAENVVNFVSRVIETLVAIAESGCDVSISDQQLITKAIDIVSALGLCPFFQTGKMMTRKHCHRDFCL